MLGNTYLITFCLEVQTNKQIVTHIINSDFTAIIQTAIFVYQNVYAGLIKTQTFIEQLY